MNINKICTLGYFDRIILDGYTMPVFNSRGIQIIENENLVESIRTNGDFNQSVGKIRINFIGESDFNISDDQLLNMRSYRENILGLNRNKLGNNDRYIIGYVDILILRKGFVLNKSVDQVIDELGKTVKSEDKILLLNKAFEIQNKNKNERSNIAVVDKIYVNKEFRGCGISKWFHNNIYDIIKVYGMIDISYALLIPGDFSNESTEIFNMNKKQYKDMLIKHYKCLGYKFINKDIMYKKFEIQKII